MPSLPCMKLWQRRKAVRSISGSARRARACENTSRVPMDSSPGGQSPIGSASTWNFVAFFFKKKELETVGPEPILTAVDLLKVRLDLFEVLRSLRVVPHLDRTSFGLCRLGSAHDHTPQ